MKKHSVGTKFKRTFEDLYEIDGNISEGGLWSVHQCRAKSSTKLYAVKILHKQAKRSIKCAEVGHVVIIQHANLIKIKELFETPTDVYLVLHFASGGELFHRLANRDSYSEYDISRCVQQIIAAVHCLHQHEIPHGNLKPENILCEADGDQLNVLIGDYAMDHIIDNRTVLQHNVWSAAGFIAPETLKGKSSDMPADLWSIGVITYILLCGYEPFHSDIEAEKYKLILKCQVSYLSDDWQDISEAGKDFIRCLLVVNPKSRPTASKILQHGWLKGPARNFQHLRAATDRLKQLISGRKLKMSTETAKSFTSKDLTETFPRHNASLEHLLHETAYSQSLPISDSDTVTCEMLVGLTPEIATGSSTDAQLTKYLGIFPVASTTGSIRSLSYDEMEPPKGHVFGDPLPWTVPSDGIFVLDKKDTANYMDSRSLFQYQLDLYTDSELLLPTQESELQSLPEDIFPAVQPLFT